MATTTKFRHLELSYKSLHFNPGIVDAVIDADPFIGRADEAQGEATAVKQGFNLRQLVCMAECVGRNAVLKKVTDRDSIVTRQQWQRTL